MSLINDITKLIKEEDPLILEEEFFYKYSEFERMNFSNLLKNLGYRVFQRQSIFGYDDYIITTDQNYKSDIFEYEF